MRPLAPGAHKGGQLIAMRSGRARARGCRHGMLSLTRTGIVRTCPLSNVARVVPLHSTVPAPCTFSQASRQPVKPSGRPSRHSSLPGQPLHLRTQPALQCVAWAAHRKPRCLGIDALAWRHCKLVPAGRRAAKRPAHQHRVEQCATVQHHVQGHVQAPLVPPPHSQPLAAAALPPRCLTGGASTWSCWRCRRCASQWWCSTPFQIRRCRTSQKNSVEKQQGVRAAARRLPAGRGRTAEAAAAQPNQRASQPPTWSTRCQTARR